jgi:phosphinothricin acetyltransferase
METENQIIFKETNLDDLNFVLDLYNYYLSNTTCTFDHEEITLEELQARLSYHHKKYKTFLVCHEAVKDMIGFCFLTQFRKKPAYDKTAEMGLYLKPEHTGRNLGPIIVKFLEEYARENQFDVIIATISGENINSVKLFEKMGYERCAHYKKIATKFGRRIDLIEYEKIL